MPVLVVGLDTRVGRALSTALLSREGEFRAFITEVAHVDALKANGIKVAVGDVSDGSHIGGAALNCFSIVFLTEAAIDDRERAFATDSSEVFAQWQEAIDFSKPRRVIWVEMPETAGSSSQMRARDLVVVTATEDTQATASEVVDRDEAAES